MLRKTLALAALMMGSVVLAAPLSPAGAGGSDYADCVITVSDSELEAGDEVDVSGVGLAPNFETDIVFDRGEDTEAVLDTVTTDAAGEFGPTTVTIPDVPAGDHTISVSCDGENINTTIVTVSSGTVSPTTGGGDGGNLPRTGSDSTEPLVLVGAAAIIGGLAFLLVARRRRAA